MHSPRILITPSTSHSGSEFSDFSTSLSLAYPTAVLAAGGLPLIFSGLPSPKAVAESVQSCDGVMLTGGEDIQPQLYSNGPIEPGLAALVKPADPERDFAELTLIEEIFRQRKPLLAICRGHQLLNVAFGGSLLMDLPSQRPTGLNHNPRGKSAQMAHQVAVTHGSLLGALFRQEKLWVNSSHHQAVDQLADLFSPTALSPDGLVEAMELRAGHGKLLPYFLSVQFHPERLIERYPEFLLLFKSFVGACRDHAKAPV